MSKKTICALALTTIISTSYTANAEGDHSHHQHHGHHDHSSHGQPIGVMGSHTHSEGDWMFSYRYSRMEMDGNRDGTDRLSAAQTRARGFMVAPLDMTMEMHMFGAMYGVNENFTLMAMVPYVRKSMNHETGALVRFKTSTEGLGDTKLTGLYKFYEDEVHNLHLNAGLSLPTGSIDERGDTPAMANAKLPYPMQLGSGTADPILALTYNGHQDAWGWGGQAGGTFRFGENGDEYRLGNEYNATAWLSRQLNDFIGVSARLDGRAWDDISGADPELNPAMVPTARTDLRGGERVDALIGVTLADGGSDLLNGHRLAAEFGMPVYQNLDGPQLETDYRFVLGWQAAF